MKYPEYPAGINHTESVLALFFGGFKHPLRATFARLHFSRGARNAFSIPTTHAPAAGTEKANAGTSYKGRPCRYTGLLGPIKHASLRQNEKKRPEPSPNFRIRSNTQSGFTPISVSK